jgi:YggT family protein
MIGALLWLLDQIVWLAIMLLIASAIMSWLVAFNVVNTRNPIVNTIWETLGKVTEPMLNPIRRILPNLGGIDISPIIAILGLQFINILARNLLGGLAF